MTEKNNVLVRICVAVDEEGGWSSSGWGRGDVEMPVSDQDDMRSMAIDSLPDGYEHPNREVKTAWILARLPIPRPEAEREYLAKVEGNG